MQISKKSFAKFFRFFSSFSNSVYFVYFSATYSTHFMDENPQGFEGKVFRVSFLLSFYLIYFQEHFTEHEADGSRVVVWAHKQASKKREWFDQKMKVFSLSYFAVPRRGQSSLFDHRKDFDLFAWNNEWLFFGNLGRWQTQTIHVR